MAALRKAELVLYVSPGSALSLRARRNLEGLLARYDATLVRLEVRDVSEHARTAEADRVLFTPTLLVKGATPTPAWIVGDLSDRETLATLLRMGGIEPRS
jgi:hypothetical protein